MDLTEQFPNFPYFTCIVRIKENTNKFQFKNADLKTID